jgi:hypothetical protein
VEDHRFKQIMHDLGQPNSQSLLVALQQVANEVAQEEQRKLVAVTNWSTMGGHTRQRWYEQHGSQLPDNTVVYVRPSGPAWSATATDSVEPIVGVEPHGWITNWPCSDGNTKPVYSHGPTRPSYGAQLDALLHVYPVHVNAPDAYRELADVVAATQERSVVYQALYCPQCNAQHIDAADVNPHNAHQCSACGWNWIVGPKHNVYIHGGY